MNSWKPTGRDAFNRHPVLSQYPEWQGNWVYDFTRCSADQTLTLVYNSNSRKWVVPGSTNMTSAVANVIQLYMKLDNPEVYTVTYTDGVENEEVFADQVYEVNEGEATRRSKARLSVPIGSLPVGLPKLAKQLPAA